MTFEAEPVVPDVNLIAPAAFVSTVEPAAVLIDQGKKELILLALRYFLKLFSLFLII